MNFTLSKTTTFAAALAASSTPGLSETATYLKNQAYEGYKHSREPISRGNARQATMDALFDTYNESSQDNWDGHGASAVTQSVYRNAYRLLEVIPDGVSFPSIGAEPDGQITFEWHQSPRQTLSLSITSEGDIHYAALLGAGRAYGTEPFLDQIPDTVLSLIQRTLS